MGIILLMVAFVIESALAAYCITTKSSHARLRSSIRIGALAGFAFLGVASVIEWNPRWYGLTALLLIWAALGTLTLIRGKADQKDYRTGRIVSHALVSLVLAFICVTPALIFPAHNALATTGAYQVDTLTETYTDANRIETYNNSGENRKLNLELWYPRNATGPYPLIVFSHGTTATRTSNASLYNELASHGYVVAAIDHTYQALFTTFPDGHTTWIDMGYVNEFATQDAHSDRQQAAVIFQKWMTTRMGDINLVIDTILAKANEKGAATPYQLVDPNEIGVAGHSLGGSAALGIGRMRPDVGAVISLEAPFMYDIQGTKDGEFVWNQEPYPTPVLNVYSDTSWSHLGEWTQYAENNALLSNTNPTAFNVYLSGANHLSLTDLSLASPFLTTALSGSQASKDAVTCLKVVNKVSLAFFDSYLKGKGTFTAAGTY